MNRRLDSIIPGFDHVTSGNEFFQSNVGTQLVEICLWRTCATAFSYGNDFAHDGDRWTVAEHTVVNSARHWRANLFFLLADELQASLTTCSKSDSVG